MSRMEFDRNPSPARSLGSVSSVWPTKRAPGLRVSSGVQPVTKASGCSPFASTGTMSALVVDR